MLQSLIIKWSWWIIIVYLNSKLKNINWTRTIFSCVKCILYCYINLVHYKDLLVKDFVSVVKNQKRNFVELIKTLLQLCFKWIPKIAKPIYYTFHLRLNINSGVDLCSLNQLLRNIHITIQGMNVFQISVKKN